MKKLFTLFFLLVCACGFSATDVVVEQGTGFKPLATGTLTVTPNTPMLIGTLPAGTRNIYITSWNGATIVGPSTSASGTLWLGAGIIASGTTVKLDGISTLKPNIYLLSNETGNTTCKIVAWCE